MIPYAPSIADAVAPNASLRFFFHGGVVGLPVIDAYTVGAYWVTRGKIDRRTGAEDSRLRSAQNARRFHRQREEEMR